MLNLDTILTSFLMVPLSVLVEKQIKISPVIFLPDTIHHSQSSCHLTLHNMLLYWSTMSWRCKGGREVKAPSS